MRQIEGPDHELLYLQSGLLTNRLQFDVGVTIDPTKAPPGPGYDWTVALPVQIYFVLLTVVAVPYFIWRLWTRFGWVFPAASKTQVRRWFYASAGRNTPPQRHLAPIAVRSAIPSPSRPTAPLTPVAGP
jgi:hypothetical protein